MMGSLKTTNRFLQDFFGHVKKKRTKRKVTFFSPSLMVILSEIAEVVQA